MLGCANGSISGTLEIIWVTPSGDFAHSTVTIAGSQSSGSVGVAVTGTVTSGLFAGDLMTATFSANPLDLLRCLLPQGMTSTTGTVIVTITRPLS